MQNTYTGRNLIFLRESTENSIDQLADLLSIEPDTLRAFEKEDLPIDHNSQYTSFLIRVSNYFCIYLDELVYSNLSCNHHFLYNILPGLFKEIEDEGGNVYRYFLERNLLNLQETLDIACGNNNICRGPEVIKKAKLRYIHGSANVVGMLSHCKMI